MKRHPMRDNPVNVLCLAEPEPLTPLQIATASDKADPRSSVSKENVEQGGTFVTTDGYSVQVFGRLF